MFSRLQTFLNDISRHKVSQRKPIPLTYKRIKSCCKFKIKLYLCSLSRTFKTNMNYRKCAVVWEGGGNNVRTGKYGTEDGYELKL